jgi:hypothetical protein
LSINFFHFSKQCMRCCVKRTMNINKTSQARGEGGQGEGGHQGAVAADELLSAQGKRDEQLRLQLAEVAQQNWCEHGGEKGQHEHAQTEAALNGTAAEREGFFHTQRNTSSTRRHRDFSQRQ